MAGVGALKKDGTPRKPRAKKVASATAGTSKTKVKVNATDKNTKSPVLPETYDREFYVEEILDKRTIMPSGKIQYFVKWEHFPVEESTWEPEEHLTHCTGKIRHYEDAQLEKTLGDGHGPPATKYHRMKKSVPRSRAVAPAPSSVVNVAIPGSSATMQMQSSVPVDNSAPAKEPERILGFSTDHRNRPSYVVEWKGSKELEIVSSLVCQERFPKLVIRYWESRSVVV